MSSLAVRHSNAIAFELVAVRQSLSLRGDASVSAQAHETLACAAPSSRDDVVGAGASCSSVGGEKKLQGCYLGSSNPHREFPRLLGLWRAGLLDLEGMVTKRRPLEEVGEAFKDLRKGVGIREVIALA